MGMIANKFVKCKKCGAQYLGNTHKCAILSQEKLKVINKKENCHGN